MQKPAKYTVVCWTRFWVNFESMKKIEKKELYFLLRCVTEISVVVVCVYACKPGYCVFKTLKDFESVKVCKCNVL